MIINLTQHPASNQQVVAGVVNLRGAELESLKQALQFSGVPSWPVIEERAKYIAALAIQNGLGGDDHDDPIPAQAMIGGAPYLMAPLEQALLDAGIQPVYAASNRVSEEIILPDGSTKKVSVFKHLGFVEVPL